MQLSRLTSPLGVSRAATAPQSEPNQESEDVIRVPCETFDSGFGFATGVASSGAGMACLHFLSTGNTVGAVLTGCALVGGIAGFVLANTGWREAVKETVKKVQNTLASLPSAVVNYRQNQRLQAEVAQRKEQAFQARVDSEASRLAESEWAEKGPAQVESVAQERFHSRLEAEAQDRVETLLAERLPGLVAERTEQALADRQAEIDAQVEAGIETHVEAQVAEKAPSKAEARLNEAVESQVREQLAAKSTEIEERVAAMVEEQTAALAAQKGVVTQSQALKALSALRTSVSQLKGELVQAYKAGGRYPSKSLEDTMMELARGVVQTSAHLEALKPESSELRRELEQDALQLANYGGAANIMNKNGASFGGGWATVFNKPSENLERAFNELLA